MKCFELFCKKVIIKKLLKVINYKLLFWFLQVKKNNLKIFFKIKNDKNNGINGIFKKKIKKTF